MMTKLLDRYEDKIAGLPYPVILIGAAEEVTDPSTGEVLGVAVPHAEELAAAVALAICFMPMRLLGPEVRFIRRVLNMTGQELARAVEMDSATLSRWENGHQPVGAWADKAVRMAAVLRLQDRAPGFSQHPEDVVTLRLSPRADDFNPKIEVHRSHAEGSDVEGWDALAKLAA